jgi:glycosyltransferase involved in cell wall biosynthesis
MKVLINNAHEESSGGGGYWASQIARAIAEFCEVDLIKKQSPGRLLNNPEMEIVHGHYDPRKQYDYFLDINHFKSRICPRAKKQIKVVYFPKINQTVNPYDQIVTLSAYSQKFIKCFWGKDSLICQPYSKDLIPGTKEERTIVVVGNIFYEADGHSKNQHRLIDAFKSLGPGWKMDIIGNIVNKTYYESLAKYSKNLSVKFHIGISDEKKEDILKSSQFFWHGNGYDRVDPLQTEHFGIAPEEALKCGCLTYVHKSGGAQDFCTTWETLEELRDMTLNSIPNPKESNFANHKATVEFWRGVLK